MKIALSLLHSISSLSSQKVSGSEWRFMKYEWIEFTAYKSWSHLVDHVENVLQNFGEKYKITFA
jgi:hypothetical protein